MLLIGSCLLGVGLVGLVGILSGLGSDLAFLLTEGAGSAAQWILVLLILSVLLLIGGLILTVLAIMKSHNKNELDSIQNLEKLQKGLGVCKRCGLNLADNCTVCPRCGERRDG